MPGLAKGPRSDLRSIFEAGIEASQPRNILPSKLPDRPAGRALVVAVGKAAAQMASVVEGEWRSSLEGLIVTRHGYPKLETSLETIFAGHPVPDEQSLRAAQRALKVAASARKGDLFLFLLSGGASSMLSLPPINMPRELKRDLVARLIKSGAPIGEINCVRRHLSLIKGGRLARAAHPARVVTLAISDVVGDDPAAIGSGPTVPDASTILHARKIAERYGVHVPAEFWSETVKPDEAAQFELQFNIIGRAANALAAASERASELGYRPLIIGDDCIGEAREVARIHAQEVMTHDESEPIALISGGELTVTVRGSGRGGPNQEYALALAVALASRRSNFSCLACDTDGADGTDDVAGAFSDSTTVLRAAAFGEDVEAVLRQNDSGRLLSILGDLHVTGPTGTNVNDLRVILCGAAR